MKELRPIRISKSDFDELEKIILMIFRKEIYLPLIAMLKIDKKVINNSIDDLRDAIQFGRIAYNDGIFLGKFDAKVSYQLRKLGAKWDRKQGGFRIPRSKLPPSVSMSISTSESLWSDRMNKIVDKLKKILPEEIAAKFEATHIFDNILNKVEKEFHQTIRDITIAPQVTPEMRKRIAAEYTQNLQLYIRDFTEKETEELRLNIQKSAAQGNRYETMVTEIQKSYGVTENKAKFLARQETNLLITKYKQTRYQEAGVNKYKWSCVKNPKDKSPKQNTPGNVRYYHGIHDGKIFSWDKPPVINAKGDRKNPGQDYNCRCTAIPIVEL